MRKWDREMRTNILSGGSSVIRLRPYKISDAKYILNWVQDERKFVMWCANLFQYPLTEQQLIDYKEMYDEEESGWSLTALGEEGIPVGHLLMRKADYVNRSVHLGFIILDEKLRGQGLGKEMVSLAVKYAFEILGVKKVTLSVFDNNPVAHQCYKSVGFEDTMFYEEIFPYQDEKWGLHEMQIENRANQ